MTDAGGTAIERRADVDLDRAGPAMTLFGTSDTTAILERMADVSAVLVEAIQARGLARRYGDADRDFIHIEGWQLLGGMLGVVAVVTSSGRLADGSGWEAHAEARMLDGRVLGAADGMCQRGEPGRARATEHTLRSMCQLRARRNALRSVLGFVLVVGGLDVSDPGAPCSRKQVVALWALAGQLGWTADEVHERAGVASLNDLSREQAGELLEEWTSLADQPTSEDPAVDEPLEPGAHSHSWIAVEGRALRRCLGCGAAERIEP